MHSKRDNIEIMICDDADEVIKKLFDSNIYQNRYQNNLQSISGSDFVLDYAQLLHYKCHKINLNRNNKSNKCFQYAVTVTLNHEEIKKDPQRITKIKSFLNKYNWKGKNFHQKKMIGKNLTKIM